MAPLQPPAFGQARAGLAPGQLTAGASLSLAAAIVAAVARAAEPFDHGIWLVTYLFLVGFLAQFLLGRCQATLWAAGSARTDAPPIRAQAALWNLGVVTVPVGVLVDARLFVVLGSVALLTALAAFCQAYRSLRLEPGAVSGALRIGYVALIVFMTVSSLVGTALASDIPWL